MKAMRKVSEKHNGMYRVKTPKVFVRCGYPLGIQDMADKIKEVPEWEILLNKLGIGHLENEEALKELAYPMLIQRKFGGNERTLHLKEGPDLLGKEVRVYGTFRVATGRRKVDFYEDDYYGYPYLKVHKYHEIALASVETAMFNEYGDFNLSWLQEDIKIPLSHLERIGD
jgi:hypothetical protein